MTSASTLSVVMPNYNHAKYLPRAIESIVSQSRPPDELLILDDASTDNSLEVLDRFAARYDCIRIYRNEANAGVNAANRRLFGLANGDYLHAAAADDARLPGFFETAMNLAEDHPQAGIIFGDLQVKNDLDQLIGHVDVRAWREPLFAEPRRYLRDYLEGELASHSASGATIYRREPFLAIGGYREELGPWADTFAARALALEFGAAYAPIDFAVDYRLPASFSQTAKDNPQQSIDVIARAAYLMRSDEFRERFPAQHVDRWESEFRRLVAWNYFLGPSTEPRPSFIVRNLQRMPRLLSSLKLLWSRGDLSCFERER